MTFVADHYCFACGADNPAGLKLRFRREGEVYATTFVAPPTLQGYHGIVHGGIVATLLDEIMARYVWELQGQAATARLNVSYRRPAPVGEPLEVRGWVTAVRRGGKATETAAEIRLGDGTLIAEATALIVRLAGPPET